MADRVVTAVEVYRNRVGNGGVDSLNSGLAGAVLLDAVVLPVTRVERRDAAAASGSTRRPPSHNCATRGSGTSGTAAVTTMAS